MKMCNVCKRSLDLSEFGRNSAKKDGLQTQCKLCRRAYQKVWYSQNQPVQAERVKKNRDKFTEEFKRVVWEILSKTPCMDCGETNPLVLEFDHRDPSDKKFTIAESKSGRKIGMSGLQGELDKCDVVCSNCHRIRTQKFFGSWRIDMAVGLVTG